RRRTRDTGARKDHGRPISPVTPRPRLFAKDFLFLGLRRRVDIGNSRIGELLHLGLRALALVLAHLTLLLVGLEIVHAVAADVAGGDARLLGILTGEFGQLLAA